MKLQQYPPTPNVLAVDDKAANVVALEGVLHDCNVLRALSGPEAISTVQERNDIDVILMDVHMFSPKRFP